MYTSLVMYLNGKSNGKKKNDKIIIYAHKLSVVPQ